ncbi:MAG: aquaporin [Christensenellaceae bacterium]|jgi:aquaporin Z|nr:aquaporin [Christensenellaceae bacterium]
MKNNLRKYIAEFFGTAVLVFIACGVAAYTGGSIVATSLAFGLTLLVLIAIIGPVSGCHVNPAVSFAMLINNKISIKDFVYYLIAQFLGAILGGALLFGIAEAIGLNGASYLGTNSYEMAFSSASLLGQAGIALLIEVILTMVFVLVVLSATRKTANKSLAPIYIGLALTVVHLLGIYFTGTSVNPARSLGVAIFGGIDALSQVWVFILAPMIGAVLAAFLARVFFGKSATEIEYDTVEEKK